MGNTIEVSGAIVPQNVYDREILEMSPRNLKIGYFKGKGGMDEDVDGY